MQSVFKELILILFIFSIFAIRVAFDKTLSQHPPNDIFSSVQMITNDFKNEKSSYNRNFLFLLFSNIWKKCHFSCSIDSNSQGSLVLAAKKTVQNAKATHIKEPPFINKPPIKASIIQRIEAITAVTKGFLETCKIFS